VAAYGRARIGCSGWEYDHWRGDFYPSDLPKSRWLAHYASVFDTVELNGTFYRLPEVETFAEWTTRVPRRFLFTVKASRYLTHMKKLKDPEEALGRLFERMAPLGKQQGPVLYQLPPGWKVNLERLEHFLQTLPAGLRHVIEFRDRSWYSNEVMDLLEQHHVALCLHDLRGSTTGRVRVGPFIYVRFHGGLFAYRGHYGGHRLDAWASWLNAQREAGLDVFAYFNNDLEGHAPRDALNLRRLLGESAASAG
jgi:uncharacterized protein YecE (DUF72 family)